MSIGKNVRRLRQAAGLSQPALAQLAGVSQQLISQLERDQQSSTKALPQIARALGVRVEQVDRNFLEVPSEEALPSDQSTPLHPGDSHLLQVPEITLSAAEEDISNIQVFRLTGKQNIDFVIVQIWQFPETFLRKELNIRRDHALIVKVTGDAMEDGSSASIRSGDRLVVDRGDSDPRQGGIFAIFDGQGIIVRQLEPVRDKQNLAVKCKPLNPRYSPFILDLNDRIFVVGRVASKITRL